LIAHDMARARARASILVMHMHAKRAPRIADV
jgi:hypothetical protein